MQLTGWFNLHRRVFGSVPDRSASRAALEKTRRTVGTWKRRCEDATGKVAALKGRLRETENRAAQYQIAIDRIKQQVQRVHRAIPSPTVLRGSLPLRVPIAQRRAQQAEARHAEERFLVSSASYQAAVRAAAERPAPEQPMVRAAVQGLHLWVPALRPRDAEPGSRWLQKQKFPYRGIAQTRELAMGGIMLDLGGNVGRMSLPRVILGDVTAAYCAEPDPLNYECLVRNVIENNLNGLVLPDNVAIGATHGSAVLFRASYCGGHTLVDNPKAKGGTIEVPMTTLDAWVSRLAIDLDLVTFVKMDVQGWEGQVFAGAKHVLSRRHIAWQIEFKPGLLRDAGTEPAEMCRLLGDCFTHFTDLNKFAAGPRARLTAELREATAYVEGSESGQTDLLLFNQDHRTE